MINAIIVYVGYMLWVCYGDKFETVSHERFPSPKQILDFEDDQLVQHWRKHVIDLEATTESKFSRHLIFRFCPTHSPFSFSSSSTRSSSEESRFPVAKSPIIFADSVECGHFVQLIFDRLEFLCTRSATSSSSSQVVPDEETAQLLLIRRLITFASPLSSPSDQTSSSPSFHHKIVVDKAVYSRNRNFRIYGSTKPNRANPLLVSPSCTFFETPSSSSSSSSSSTSRLEYSRFLHSMICFFDRAALFGGSRKKPLQVLKCKYHWKHKYTDTIEKILHSLCSQETIIFEDVHYPTSLDPEYLHSKDREGSFWLTQEGMMRESESPASFSSGSPFPDLDALVVEIIKKRGLTTPQIRSWSFFSERRILAYNIENSRFCDRIARHHKSNHVNFVADLRRLVCYQKCLDPDCRLSSHRPIEYPIPPSCVSALLFSDIDDDALLDLPITPSSPN